MRRYNVHWPSNLKKIKPYNIPDPIYKDKYYGITKPLVIVIMSFIIFLTGLILILIGV